MFQSPKMTNAGKALYYDSLTGDGIVFTKIKMGKGEIEQSIVNMTDLVDPVVSIDAVLSKANDGSYVDISGSFSNAGLSQGFYWREIGLFAQNPEKPDDRTADILYCYQNAFDTADFIPTASVESIEKYITIPIMISDNAQISCLIDQSLIFTTKKELEEHNENKDAHAELLAKKADALYGVCETSSTTSEKIVTIDADFELKAGVAIDVRFEQYDMTTSPSLNVNNTGAKLIKAYGTTAPGARAWYPKEIVRFVYDGEYWIMQNAARANAYYYGVTKLSTSTSSTASDLAATPSAVKSAYDKANSAYLLAEAAIPKSQRGEANGVATLNTDSKIPSEQLPDLAQIPSSQKGLVPVVTTEGTGAAYTATLEGVTSLYAGLALIMVPHTTSTSVEPTLNVNGLGDAYIARRASNNTQTTYPGTSASWLKKGMPVLLIYDVDCWVVTGQSKTIVSDIQGTVGISKGGTGKTNAEQALYALMAGVQWMAPTELDDSDFISIGIGSNNIAKSMDISDFKTAIGLDKKADLDADGKVPVEQLPSREIVKITESGTWTCPEGVQMIDLFLVSGGQSGSRGRKGNGGSTSGESPYSSGGNGGKGGKAVYVPNYKVTPGKEYDISIGNGGIASDSLDVMVDGTDTIFERISTSGSYPFFGESSDGGTGGELTSPTSSTPSDGVGGKPGYASIICPIDGMAYCISGSGGGSGARTYSTVESRVGGDGGLGGYYEGQSGSSGGKGGDSTRTSNNATGSAGLNGTNGADNTGNGGGGGGGSGSCQNLSNNRSTVGNPGKGGNGGSGIVILRCYY